jgi:hypothetical protein
VSWLEVLYLAVSAVLGYALGKSERRRESSRNRTERRHVAAPITWTSNTRQWVAKMADIGQVLATCATTIVGVAVGAGLTLLV